jgi:hypothetical protein
MTPDQTRVPYRFAPAEPSLDDLLADPIVQKLMEQDGERREDVTELIGLLRRHLIAKRWRRTE